jgi:alcohol dehydrogenase class IV
MFAGQLPTRRQAELIMVPTTAGTGSESTPNAIVFRPSTNLKVGIVCDTFMPDKVILDPELLTGLPAAITAATGMDALCHALECYISNKANLFSDMMAVEAIRLIFQSLKRCFANGNDIDARADLLFAAFLGGACIAASGTNGVHALSYPLGGRYRIPHGISNAVLLAPVLAFNKDSCTDKLAAIAHLTGADVSGLDNGLKADVLVQALYDLSRELGIPGNISVLGVPAEDLESIVDAALQVKRLLDNNPKPMSRNDIRNIYQGVF